MADQKQEAFAKSIGFTSVVVALKYRDTDTSSRISSSGVYHEILIRCSARDSTLTLISVQAMRRS